MYWIWGRLLWQAVFFQKKESKHSSLLHIRKRHLIVCGAGKESVGEIYEGE